MGFGKAQQAFVKQVIDAIDEFFHCSGSGECGFLMIARAVSLIYWL